MSAPSTPDSTAMFGVIASVTGRRWTARLDGPGLARAEALLLEEGMGDILARVLAARGVERRGAQAYLNPRLRDLMPDPEVLRDMAAAVARLAHAARNAEKVAIFGDYDVDGACAAALLSSVLRQAGADPFIYIPDRITEGYGPNVEAIRTLHGQGATLLVTVDCGTASHAPLGEARALGLDAVVLDHHQAPEVLPDAVAIVNPNRQDDLSGLGALCAAGVVFLAMVALNRALRLTGHWSQDRPEPDLMAELDLVALATIADVAALTGLNRAFVRQGLAVMRQRQRLGLSALMDISGLDGPVEAWHLGFLLGPRINAGGRIGDAAMGARLMLETDEMAARHLASELDALNRARQDIEKLAVEEAMAMAEHTLASQPDTAVIITQSDEWHPGIVGLVASRLKERFCRPAFALALDGEGRATGSGRSIAGVDLGRAVRAAVDQGMAIKGGGHAMAAGVTLEPGGIAAFAAGLTTELARQVGEARRIDVLAIDAALTATSARPALLASLEAAGPFGAGSPEPVFAFPSHRLMDATVVGSGGHVRIKLRAGDGAVLGGIVFRAADEPLGRALLAARGEMVHVVGTLSIDRWGGGEKVQLRVIDMALATGPTHHR